MAEFVSLYSGRKNLKSLLTFCLVTKPSRMYPDWQEPEQDELTIIGQWDTGASFTVIHKSLVDVLGLKPTGEKMRVRGANGVYDSDTYIIDLYLSNGIVFKDLLVTEMPEKFDGHVLIGLDVILQSDFVLEPYGDDLLLKFRYPSEGNKPFVAVPNSLIEEE